MFSEKSCAAICFRIKKIFFNEADHVLIRKGFPRSMATEKKADRLWKKYWYYNPFVIEDNQSTGFGVTDFNFIAIFL